MQTPYVLSVVFYCLFVIFLRNQQLHVKRFQGASAFFDLALNVSASVGMLTGLVYLLYYGWSVVWWAPIVIFIIGLITSLISLPVQRGVGWGTLSLSGFLGLPVCAYFMFSYIP